MIRYYPDVIYQNKMIKKKEAELGYTGHSAKEARIAYSKVKGKKGWMQMMNMFAKNKPTPKEAKQKKIAGQGYGNRLMFGPGWMPRTIGGDADFLNMPIKMSIMRHNKLFEQHKILTSSKAKARYQKTVKALAKNPSSSKVPAYSKFIKKYVEANSDKGIKEYHKKQDYWLGMYQHGLSLGDMTDFIYQCCQHNPNTMSFWYPPLMKAYDQSNHFFKVPQTKIWTLPIEVAQYLQTDYRYTNKKSRDALNKLCINVFNLDMDKTYFIKTGVFSGKYEFRNAHCKEPDQMGEYFHVINNFAMQLGASTSVDLCVRQWIPDPEHRPTIYHGMPLRTEFRSFIDFDKKKVIGIVPYWNPIVMDNVLSKQGKHNPAIQRDYETYHKNIPFMMKEFNAAVPELREQIGKLIQHAQEPLHGKWSLDIMKSGKNFYLIDMALMANSALKELLPKYHF